MKRCNIPPHHESMLINFSPAFICTTPLVLPGRNIPPCTEITFCTLAPVWFVCKLFRTNQKTRFCTYGFLFIFISLFISFFSPPSIGDAIWQPLKSSNFPRLDAYINSTEGKRMGSSVFNNGWGEDGGGAVGLSVELFRCSCSLTPKQVDKRTGHNLGKSSAPLGLSLNGPACGSKTIACSLHRFIPPSIL